MSNIVGIKQTLGIQTQQQAMQQQTQGNRLGDKNTTHEDKLYKKLKKIHKHLKDLSVIDDTTKLEDLIIKNSIEFLAIKALRQKSLKDEIKSVGNIAKRILKL